MTLKLNASLKSVRTQKDITEDVLQSVTFHIWGTAEEIGALNALYKLPLSLTIEEKK